MTAELLNDLKLKIMFLDKFIIIAAFIGIAVIIEWLLVARGRGLVWCM